MHKNVLTIASKHLRMFDKKYGGKEKRGIKIAKRNSSKNNVSLKKLDRKTSGGRH